MESKKYLTTTELADLLGISRVAVFQKIKAGSIPAKRKGRRFLIAKHDVAHLLADELTDTQKKKIDEAVNLVIGEYGETLRLLGQE